jgi:flagella synthesis protein FlgN
MESMANDPAATLEEERRVAQELIDCLKDEQQCLISADMGTLVLATGEKSALVTRLATLARARHRALGMAGHSADEAGMSAWLETSRKSPTHEQQWQGLLALARDAKELNRVNGILIGGHLSRTQGLLQAMRGGTPNAGVYGPDGQHSVSGMGRALVVG